MHRVATQEREEIERTTKLVAGRHSKEGGDHLEQDSIRQTIAEDTDGGFHPAVDGQRRG